MQAIIVLIIGKSMSKKVFKIIEMPKAIKNIPTSVSNNILLDLKLKWGEQWVSNPRPPEPQSGALPAELCSPSYIFSMKKVYGFCIKKQYANLNKGCLLL